MAFRLRPRSIHGELALLVGVPVLPFVAMTAYLLYQQAQRDLEEARSVVRELGPLWMRVNEPPPRACG
ncbi:MAG TPA: hypothetical protein VLA30_16640 [Burkholderiales bacterium]|nr:hypothetical protein [Burkholderiales bacterium]